jgi:hypothetical protein
MKDACQLCPNPQNLPPHKKKRKKKEPSGKIKTDHKRNMLQNTES